MSGKRPTVYIIAGPNGSGKTTFALRYLPLADYCVLFDNSPLKPISVAEYVEGRVHLMDSERYRKIRSRLEELR